MRPVDKQAPSTYPYDNEAAEKAKKHTFQAKKNVATVYAPFGTLPKKAPAKRMSMYEIMQELLDKKINGNVFPNEISGNRASAIKSMEGVLPYRNAFGDLVDMFSRYCSFCELPLPMFYLEVEHRASKAQYPTYFLWWWNFLLACKQCNTIKSDDPMRPTTIAWANKAGIPAPDENELVDQIKSHYFWADLDEYCYRVFPMEFWYDTDTTEPVDMDGSEYSSSRNVLVDATDTTVTANVYENGSMHNSVEVQCQLVQNASNPKTGNRTLKLTGLDQPDSGRAVLRTVAWLVCCQQLDSLFTQVSITQAGKEDQAFNLQWATLLVQAMSSGFYSTWLRVLMKRDFPAGVTVAVKGTYAKLGEKFVDDTKSTSGRPANQIIKGTNYTKVP